MSEVFIHPSADVAESAVIGEGTQIRQGVLIEANARIGKNSIIARNCWIDEGVEIGDDVLIEVNSFVVRGNTIESKCFIGPNVTLTNDLYPRSKNPDFEVLPTLVKEGASIGGGATIICGVTLGEYCMVGAGSVVKKDVAPYRMVFGNPAQVIGIVCKCGRKVGTRLTLEPGEVPECSRCEEKRRL